MSTYRTFTRTWYRSNPTYPGGREPHAGRQYTHERGLTEAQSFERCKQWNSTHKPGRLSRKMEYTREDN